MWNDSKKWVELRKRGNHRVVGFDVYCCHCNKQLGEDVNPEKIESCGLQSFRPMHIFCDANCAAGWQLNNKIDLLMYGWRPLFQLSQPFVTPNEKELHDQMRLEAAQSRE